MKHFYSFPFFQDAEDRTINVWLVAVQQMPELVTFGRQRTSLGVVLQGENRLFEPKVRSQGRGGVLDVDLVVQVAEIAFSASGQV